MIVSLYLIEILHQTTTGTRSRTVGEMLYLIEILHQTTTALRTLDNGPTLYLIEILHQTTTEKTDNIFGESCILSKFYIKPQHYIPLLERS